MSEWEVLGMGGDGPPPWEKLAHPFKAGKTPDCCEQLMGDGAICSAGASAPIHQVSDGRTYPVIHPARCPGCQAENAELIWRWARYAQKFVLSCSECRQDVAELGVADVAVILTAFEYVPIVTTERESR